MIIFIIINIIIIKNNNTLIQNYVTCKYVYKIYMKVPEIDFTIKLQNFFLFFNILIMVVIIIIIILKQRICLALFNGLKISLTCCVENSWFGSSPAFPLIPTGLELLGSYRACFLWQCSAPLHQAFNFLSSKVHQVLDC